MKVKISGAASQDLLDGFHFYECQDKGLGVYFLDTLFSDIDSLIGLFCDLLHEDHSLASFFI